MIRRFVGKLDKQTAAEISTGLSQFSHSGLKEFAAFAVAEAHTLAEVQKTIKASTNPLSSLAQ